MTTGRLRDRLPSSGLGPPTVVAATLAGALLVSGLVRPIRDPDVWWHLLYGRMILATGALPSTDAFSFTATGHPIVLQQWGGQVALHLLEAGFGLRGLLIWRAIMLVAFYGLVAWMLVREGGHRLSTWAIIMLVAISGIGNWTTRMNLFSFVLFVTLLLIALDERRSSLWVMPIMVVWANVHGMFLVGIGLLVVLAVGQILQSSVVGPPRPVSSRYWLMAGLGAVSTFLNPYGWRLHAYTLDLIGTVSAAVPEWGSPDFHDPVALVFLALVLVTFGCMAVDTNVPPPVADLVLAASFTVFGLLASRNMTLAAVVLGLVATKHLRSAGDLLATERDRAELASPLSRFVDMTLIAIIGIVTTVAVWIGFPRSGDVEHVAADGFPIEAIESLPSDTRLFTRETWAGIALYLRWPHVLVAYDTRFDFYGPDALDRYRRTLSAQPGALRSLEDQCLTHVLIDERAPLDGALRQDGAWGRVSAFPAPDDSATHVYEFTQVPGDCPRRV